VRQVRLVVDKVRTDLMMMMMTDLMMMMMTDLMMMMKMTKPVTW